MKVGVITDIHGNIDALNAVLEEFETRNVDKIICCGDIIGIGNSPEECVRRIMDEGDNIIVVRGNHEKYFIEGIPEVVHDEKVKLSDEERGHHKWQQDSLSEESKEYIRKIPLSKIVNVEGKNIYVCHYPMNEDKTFKRHISMPNFEECEELFSNIDADVFLYGHTHKENLNTNNGKWYINPGSVGCPESFGCTSAGILTIENNEINYEQINIKYDVEKVVKRIQEIKYPQHEGILRKFYGKN